MTIVQVIVLVIIAIAIFLPQIKLLFLTSKIDPSKLNNSDAITIMYGNVISWLFIMMLFGLCVTQQIKVNELLSNNPCPELERLENVYKIK